MIWTIYTIILIYFVLGAVAFTFINKGKDKRIVRNNNVKLITYFLIINLIFFSIIINTIYFRLTTVIIVLFGFYELYKLYRNSGDGFKKVNKHLFIYIISNILLIMFSCSVYMFGLMEKESILFAFIIISVFDSFSQISGQLWGKRKIVPKISPAKTLGGVIGGVFFSFLCSYLISGLVNITYIYLIPTVILTVLFAFLGDLLASAYKRAFGVKDFSNIIPGHGGFLDRFDSMLAGSAGFVLANFITSNNIIF